MSNSITTPQELNDALGEMRERIIALEEAAFNLGFDGVEELIATARVAIARSRRALREETKS